MRHLKFLIPAFLFLSLFAMNADIASARVAQESTQKKNQDLLNKIQREQIIEHEKDRDDNALQTREQTTVATAGTGEAAKHATAMGANDTKLAQEIAMNNSHTRHMNKDDYACSYISVAGGLGKAQESAAQSTKMKLAERLKVIASEAGSKSENGLVDFQNQLFDEMQGLDVTRMSIGELLNSKNIPQGGQVATQLEYLQNMLYARVPVYLNKDLLDNADTEVKNLSIQADRLRSEASVGQAIFSIIEGARAPMEGGGKGVAQIKEIMQANEYSSQYIQELLPSNASLRAQLEGLALGQFGQKYMQEKFIDNPDNIPIGVLFNSMLTNVLLFKQYELLEGIATATATNIIASREEAIKDVNARISRKNARQ